MLKNIRTFVESAGPVIDKELSFKGQQVVLGHSHDEIRLLSFDCGFWMFTGHPSAMMASGQIIQLPDFIYKEIGYMDEEWQGYGCLDKSSDLGVWMRLYGMVRVMTSCDSHRAIASSQSLRN